MQDQEGKERRAPPSGLAARLVRVLGEPTSKDHMLCEDTAEPGMGPSRRTELVSGLPCSELTYFQQPYFEHWLRQSTRVPFQLLCPVCTGQDGQGSGLTLRISLEPKPESMRVSRSMSRMAQATSRCRLGPGSPVHSTYECRREVEGQSLPEVLPRSASPRAHLPQASTQAGWPTSHSRRTSGKGNSLLNQMSSHRKQKQREPESWESRGGERWRVVLSKQQAQSQCLSPSNSQCAQSNCD